MDFIVLDFIIYYLFLNKTNKIKKRYFFEFKRSGYQIFKNVIFLDDILVYQ